MKLTCQNSVMPMMNEAAAMAQATRRLPMRSTSVIASRWAAPVSDSTFPSIAPRATITPSCPMVSPTPFSIDRITPRCSGVPSRGMP